MTAPLSSERGVEMRLRGVTLGLAQSRDTETDPSDNSHLIQITVAKASLDPSKKHTTWLEPTSSVGLIHLLKVRVSEWMRRWINDNQLSLVWPWGYWCIPGYRVCRGKQIAEVQTKSDSYGSNETKWIINAVDKAKKIAWRQQISVK